jgi:hypothetical protein
MIFPPDGNPLVVAELGVELLAVAAQAVRPGQHPARPVLCARAERLDRPVRPQAYGSGGQEGVQAPVKPDRYPVTVPAGLRHRIRERDISPDPAASDAIRHHTQVKSIAEGWPYLPNHPRSLSKLLSLPPS